MVERIIKILFHTIQIYKMLKYCMFILSKVSFDSNLFEKELNKAIAFINVREEIIELENWCRESFGETYQIEIDRCFNYL